MKKAKTQKTYATVHNKTLENYRRCTRFILWIALINSLGVLLTMFFNQFGFSTCLESNYVIFYALDKVKFPDNNTFFLSCLAISLVFAIPFVILYYFAHKGKSWALYTAFIVYIIDFTLVFILNNYQVFSADLLYRLGIHLVITAFLCLAIFNYHSLIVLAKRYRAAKNTDTSDKTLTK